MSASDSIELFSFRGANFESMALKTQNKPKAHDRTVPKERLVDGDAHKHTPADLLTADPSDFVYIFGDLPAM